MADVGSSGGGGALGGLTVEVIWQSERGDTIRRLRSKPKKGGIVLGRDARTRALAVVVTTGDDGESVFSTKGGISLHGKFIPQGMASIRLIKQRIQIQVVPFRPHARPCSSLPRKAHSIRSDFSDPLACCRQLSKSSPTALSEFMKLFVTKLQASRVNKENTTPLAQSQAEPRVPYMKQPFKSKLYAPPLDVVDISPASDRERALCPSLKRGRDVTISPKLSIEKRQKLLASLTAEQRGVLDAVLSGQNVFFTGKAGTGKSYMLRKLLAALPSEKTVVTASTGVAACNIGGITLHSFAGFKPGSGKMPRQTQQWRSIKRLVIDEISMVDGEWFDELETVARRVRGCAKPFGGIQLIVCGDFLQLPPVSKGGNPKQFCFSAKSWNSVMTTCIELHTVHRQKDPTFVDLLGRIREGKCSSEDAALLRSTSGNNVGYGDVEATRLCTHVADAESINIQKLNMLSGAVHAFAARDDVGGDAGMLRVLNAACRAPAKLELKIGAQVMLVKNLDLRRGLANGSRGVVQDFSKGGQPIVRFLTGEVQTMHAETWTVGAGNGRGLSRRQIPLQLAWGISIHKSQGMTLDAVELDLSRCFEYGQAYVALSRARSLEGLRVRNFSSACVRAHPAVLRFYEDCKM